MNTSNKKKLESIFESIKLEELSSYPFLYLFVVALILSFSTYSSANNISVVYSQLEENVALPNDNINLNPAGLGVFISFDLSPKWRLGSHYQTWQDDVKTLNAVKVDVDIQSWGGNVSYSSDSWYFSSGINYSQDDTLISAQQRTPYLKQENTRTKSLNMMLSYNWLQDNWMYDLSLGAQYNDWQVSNYLVDRQSNNLSEQQLEDDFNFDGVSINASVSVARCYLITGDEGVLVGSMLLWSYAISGDEYFSYQEQQFNTGLSRQQTRTNRTNLGISNAGSGDGNSGQLTFYASYDLNVNWALDFDTAIEIATDNQSPSWSVGLSYSF